MDYEKKYKAVLEQARDYYNRVQTDYARKELENIFPELRESEDERIRKGIIEIIKAVSGPDCDVYLDEKKQEKYLAWLEKQKEQNPVEKQDYSGLNDLERAIHRGFLCAGVENVPATIIKETAQDCLAHMPAWSEEDEKKMIFLERLIEYNVPDGQYGWADGRKGGFVTKSEAISMLKSLRSSWKPSEEQMNALLIASADSKTDGLALRILYEQLKKL